MQLDNFPAFADAGEARFPTYAAHMRDLHAGAATTIMRRRYEAGVPIYAGTDAGGVLPHGLIGREVLALRGRSGLAPEAALAAASLGGARLARAGRGLADGEPADLVVYAADPRADLRACSRIPARSSCAAAWSR